MRILLTGFDPFGGEKVNPAYEAVKLVPEQVSGAEIIKKEVPTVFGEAGRVLEQAILAHEPDAVICVGQAGGNAAIAVERVAINLMEARIPDNAGNQPMDCKCQEDGPAAYFASLPVKAMVQQMRKQGIPAELSYSAGSYVCNNIMYDLLYLIDKKYPHIHGGFIHVPYATEQGVDKPAGTPTMAVADMARALEAGIATVVEGKEAVLQAGSLY